MQNQFDLSGRNAVVTGATSGMGLSIARALGKAGASAPITGRDAGSADGVADDVAGLALLLASPAGRFIHGQNISVDGGLTA